MKAPKWLRALGIPEPCIALKSSAEERGRRFSIRPNPGDRIWRVRVDGCWRDSSNGKKVDYLFWGQSSAKRRVVLLVELKGKHLGDALLQIERTLERLCKQADGQGIHIGPHQVSPGHDRRDSGGVQAHVILSHGREMPQQRRKLEGIRKKYHVLVYHREKRREVNGLDALP